jgi:hypothetical protein
MNRITLLTLLVALLVGCNGSEPAQSTNSPAAAPIAPPPPPPPPVVPKAPQMVQKKAEVGVGKKGRGYGLGVVATPAASYFAMREKIAFNIQIPQAMNLFKASEGRAPKSHEEFMERIIKEQHIPLPELREGERYRYDPKTEELMVEGPAPE